MFIGGHQRTHLMQFSGGNHQKIHFSCRRRCPFVRKLLRRVIIIAATPLLIDNVAAVAAAGGKIA